MGARILRICRSPSQHVRPYSGLQSVLRLEHVDTLMTYLPRDAADQVATKADIACFEQRFAQRFDGLEARMTRLEVTSVRTRVGLPAIYSLVVTFLV